MKSLKDDKTGHDHIGYADYAMCLSSLIFGALETPCVIGIYAQWGTGKSFIMEKIKVALKALQLEQTLFDHWPDIAPSCYVDDLRELIENGEEQILLMFDWVQMGMPELPLKAFHKIDGDNSTLIGLDPAYFDQVKADNQQMDTTALWLLCLLMARIIAVIFTPITLLGKTLCKAWYPLPKVDSELSPMLYWLLKVGKERRSKERDQKDKPTTIDYHYIWWNAWLYSGSDNLWAGLIKALHEAIEQRYGAPYVCRSKSHSVDVSSSSFCIYVSPLLAGTRTSRCNDDICRGAVHLGGLPDGGCGCNQC